MKSPRNVWKKVDTLGRRIWQPAEDYLLGRMPDAEVARLLDRTNSQVVGRRNYLRIPAVNPVGRPVGCKSPWADHKKGKKRRKRKRRKTLIRANPVDRVESGPSPCPDQGNPTP